MAQLIHPPAQAAAIIRGIGQRRTLPSLTRSYLCAPCAVSWAGDEADCWNCGNPASTEYTRRDAAALVLRAGIKPRRGGAAA
jgi:hypothetical protein